MQLAVSALAALIVVGSAAAPPARALDLAPAPKVFIKDGESYRWQVAHGVTGGLILSGPLRADGSNIDLVITCSGLRSGGVQVRFYEPKPGASQLRLRTATSVFRVPRGAQTYEARAFLEGRGDVPRNFFKALARTPTISVEYAGQSTDFAGPGVALTEHFQRYCSSLARRAVVDE